MISDDNIGFIGLGNVGSKLANNILINNKKLFIYDLNIDHSKELVSKGAIWCSTIEKLVQQSNIIITCLPSAKAVNDVILGNNGVYNFINNNKLWIEMSTTDEKEIIKFSQLFKKIDAHILEAPITGGQHRAISGNIAILAGGERKIFDRAFPLLSLLGHKILYCGKIGNASTLKIITNFLASVNLLAIGEALVVSKKYGIDLETAYHGIKISSGNSFVHETESQVILSGSYDVGFTMDLVCKDVNLFNDLTIKYNIPADISNLTVKSFEAGKKELGNRAFSTSIVKRLENFCNVSLRASNFPKKLIDVNSKLKGFEVKF